MSDDDKAVLDQLGARFSRWSFGLIGTGLMGALAIGGGTYVQIQSDHARDEQIHAAMRADIADLQDGQGAVQDLAVEVSSLASKVDTSARDTQRRLESMERLLERLQERQTVRR